ncbi:protein kinase [Azospirillum sp. YIM B02556]|uniref:non-specific serine/threonine protein kinase n=1 Tax=Azospirillum endophyticum TaxID=2800326 RepID=A0ABS1F6K4_9PROT|nr:serine/threonine-protein kinase [Azospirillum endophyticum]MBK1839035.1 protein kinase [Azospirillum endophyticum]
MAQPPTQFPGDSHEPTALPPAATAGPADGGLANPGTGGGTDMEATRLTTPPAAGSQGAASQAPVSSVPPSSVSGVGASGPRGVPDPIGPGTLLSHTYLVEGLIARGGMGEVHRARHVDMDTWHAVKVIRPELAQDAKMVELLRREAAALREIRHEAVVSYDGVFRDEYGRLLLSMEFLDGPSLLAVLQGGALDAASVAILLDRIASGLAAAHQRGIVHRDMSTDNVILPGREIANAKIIDFGIAKQTAGGAGTVIGDAFAGKYGYASPEQFGLFGGQVGPQSDIYSAGLVLAAAALGHPLDMGRTPQAMIERRMAVPDLSALDEPLRGVLCSMLEPDPQTRVKTMAELVGALTRRPAEITPFEITSFPAAKPEAGAKPVATTAAQPGLKEAAAGGKAADRPKKAPVGLIAGGVGGLAAAGVAGFLLFGQSQPPAPSAPSTQASAPATMTGTATAPATPASVAPPPSAMTTAPLGTSAPATQLASTAVPASTPAADAAAKADAAPVKPPSEPASPPPATPAVQVAPSQNTAPQNTSPQTAVPTPVQPQPQAQVVPASVPAAPPVPRLTPAEARKAVEAAAGGFACAGVKAAEAGNGVKVGGYVGSDEDARVLKAALTALPAGIDVDAQVAVRPWPLCEALGVAGLPARAEGQGANALGLGFNRPSMVYRKGEKLEVTVTAGTAGYLTVDYIDMEGNAIHMVPMRLRRDDRLEAGRPVTLGVARSASDRVYTIAPPYGAAMILALVTRDPLFPADREEVEPAGAYLASLRTALAQAEAKGGVVAQSAFFTTVAE